ncbi:hypothetical protein M422DRAFT_274582 [Sphaerobolus stellatus SS14]|uniref:Uncharacterized protein n=1 Tax=Sphaerobolus stellatus (strain SS14) TaxID=990650 RepID=A0A0C9UHA0_SPHS4|nr:hypothetical protein M422DRAFT_274582 [Sphaerobolus stellatus SS14]
MDAINTIIATIAFDHFRDAGDFFMLCNIWMGLQMKDEVDAKAWADLKWHQFIGQDNVLAQLSVDSCITVWGDQEGHTVITTHKREWSKSVSVALVKNWTDEMDKGSGNGELVG